jgi:DNA phosphorothioation-associated putative methyltransferase
MINTISERLRDLRIGKFIGGHLYIHTSGIFLLPEDWQQLVSQASAITGLIPDRDFNVLKLHVDGDELSLLSYREFLDDPFPALIRSWRISLSRRSVIFRTYEESRNPPILHRKELLLPPTHARIAEYAALTESAEALGLFADTSRIGFRDHWYSLIAESGYHVVEGQLVPIANADEASPSEHSDALDIRRHLTALSRSNFSAPLQALLRHGLIGANLTFFDYGCGRGDDVRSLLANGIEAAGWDPHYAPDADKRIADTVNIGFVINVIEDIAERVDALKGAYSYTRGVLSVSAMLNSQLPPEGRPYKDGYLSSRNTFQKYFSQAQLRDFIEHTLDENAIAVGPGVFFVFRDKDLEQRFLSERYGHRAQKVLSRGWMYTKSPRPPKEPRAPRQPREPRQPTVRIDRATLLFETYHASFARLWLKCLELGRPPERLELEQSTLEVNIGSVSKALQITLARFDAQELELASKARTSDLLVFGALQQFQKRTPYRQLEQRLQIDIRYFFGDYSSWQGEARQVLFTIGDLEAIDAACRLVFEKGYGYLDEGVSLQLHASMLERLPTLLRVYVACATILCGDISEFDLIKIHSRSGKVTLMKFDDFENVPLPRLRQRIKVNLRDQDLDTFSYGEEYAPSLLYHKSRYINEEFPRYAEQVGFEEALNTLNLHDLRGYGPSETKFLHELDAARYQINGFKLIRSTRIPNLDEPCGKNFTYRQLIECGETQARTGLANLPKEPDSYTALYELATKVLDPVIDYYGMIKLTYGFCSPELAKQITGRISPELDQHAAHEKKRSGKLICARLGAACDFLVEDEDMEDVAAWLYENINIDRIYIYGPNKPIHVSYSTNGAGEVIRMIQTPTGKQVPRVIKRRTWSTRKRAT